MNKVKRYPKAKRELPPVYPSCMNSVKSAWRKAKSDLSLKAFARVLGLGGFVWLENKRTLKHTAGKRGIGRTHRGRRASGQGSRKRSGRP